MNFHRLEIRKRDGYNVYAYNRVLSDEEPAMVVEAEEVNIEGVGSIELDDGESVTINASATVDMRVRDQFNDGKMVVIESDGAPDVDATIGIEQI